jgi:hypothetical protein
MSRRATQIYLTAEQHSALRESARVAGRSIADIVRELVDRHIMPDGRRQLDPFARDWESEADSIYDDEQ